MKIFQATAELAPLAKTGGLADVSAALSLHLQRSGHDVRVVMPFYDTIDVSGLAVVPVDYLQEVPITIGGREGYFSVDTVQLPGTGLSIYLLRSPDLYQRGSVYTQHWDEHRRFILLCRACPEICQRMGFAPDIFHCHDWHTGLIPLYLKSIYAWDQLFAQTRSIMTIHNIGYQGMFSSDVLPDLDLNGFENLLHQDDLHDGVINFLKTSLLYADHLTTVSPTYAREIQTDAYGMGLQTILRGRRDSLTGILNGVDGHEWDPETDTLIPFNFTAMELAGKRACKRALMNELGLTGEIDQPLLGMVTRLTSQKGLDLLHSALPEILARRPLMLAVLGSGESRYEHFFGELQHRFPGQVCFYRGYNNRLAHWIEAGSDLFLMPSLYEPCGLNQMYSLKYGTVPVVRETGGLADSVQQINVQHGTGTGVLFRDYDDIGLRWALETALDLYANRTLWMQVMRNGMAQDFSWQRQGAQYEDLYRQLTVHG
ncbi:MAG: glycogen synthase GlgA [Pseudomonadota bacterium]